MKRAFLALALCLPAARSAGAAGFNAAARGTTTAEFLSLGAGARAVAMGQAYGAAADDATALYWNPPLTRVPLRSATLMHAAYVDSSFFDYVAYAQNLGAWGAFGTSFQYFSAGQIKQTDATGTDVGSFTPYDLAVSAGYAYRLGGIEFMPDFNGFSLGVSAKLIQSKILATAQTAAVDVGLLTPAYWNGRFRGSLTVTNLGGRMRFEETAEALPAAARLAARCADAGLALIRRRGLPPRRRRLWGAWNRVRDGCQRAVEIRRARRLQLADRGRHQRFDGRLAGLRRRTRQERLRLRLRPVRRAGAGAPAVVHL